MTRVQLHPAQATNKAHKQGAQAGVNFIAFAAYFRVLSAKRRKQEVIEGR